MAYFQILATYFSFLAFGGVLAVIRRWVRPNAKTSSALNKGPVYILLNAISLTAIWLPLWTHSFALILAVLAASVSWEMSHALEMKFIFRLLQSFATGVLILAADWLPISSLMQFWSIIILLALPIVSLWFSNQMAININTPRTIPDLSIPADLNTQLSKQTLGSALLNLVVGLVYLPFCLVPLIWLWHSDVNGYKITFFYLVIVINDAFSQFTGQLVGRTPLAPAISPSKTVEGSFGGILFSALLGVSLSGFGGWSSLQTIWLAVLIALSGQIGDLTESSWKRALGLKDFSSALGAQGGILDRFDALIFAAPVFCLLIRLWP
jgi:CDP-diglyceride synthetase